MSETIEMIRRALMYSAGFTLLTIGILAACLYTCDFCRYIWRVLGKNRTRAGMLAAAFSLAFYAGGKGGGTISFPRTDADLSYLVDAGSYVTNDYIHVAFTTRLVPTTGALYIDRRPVSSTNDADWVTHIETTIGAFTSPTNITYSAATGMNWQVYTTWTPGPSVVTNGVLHATWTKGGGFILPVRTVVLTDGATSAPPVSVSSSSVSVASPTIIP